MQKDELVRRLYGALQGQIDTEAMQHNVMFQVQLMAAIMPPDAALDLQPLLEKIPEVIDMEDFLEYWVDAIGPSVDEEELQLLVDYFESENYQRTYQLMQRLEPLIQGAMISYATAIGDKLLDGFLPAPEPAVMN